MKASPPVALNAVWIIEKNYLLPAVVSMLSYLRHVDGPVSVMCPAHEFDELRVELLGLVGNISIGYFKPDNAHPNELYHSVIANREARFTVVERANENEITLLVDADTIFSPRVVEVLEILAANPTSERFWGVVEYSRASDAYLYFKAKDRAGVFRDTDPKSKERCYEGVFGKKWRDYLAAPQPNNGFIAFRNARALAAQWRTFYRQGLLHAEVNPEDDQVPLAAAMAAIGFTFHRLEEAFNSKGEVNGPYAVFHAYAGLWRNEFRAALAPIATVSSFATIARGILPALPPALLNAFRVGSSDPYLYLAIPGFFDFSAFYWKTFHGCESGCFIEIGTYRGKSTCYMAELIRSTGKAIRFSSFDAYIREVTHEEVRASFGANGLLPYVDLIKERSETACQRFEDKTLDMVFIDGGHDYDQVMLDLESWFPKVKPGGLLAGDDYTISEVFELGVRRAVNDFALKRGLKLEVQAPCFVFHVPGPV